MKRKGELSEAEQLLLAQSDDLDPLFFDMEVPTEELFPAEDGAPPDRPRTRADCLKGPRPCPWIMCRHHL